MPQKCCGKNSDASIHKATEFLKIIAEENRLKILCILKKRNKERCVCDIWQCLGLPQNLTSHHLKVLKDAGLVVAKQEGLKVFYSLNKKEMDKYLELLNNFLNE